MLLAVDQVRLPSSEPIEMPSLPSPLQAVGAKGRFSFPCIWALSTALCAGPGLAPCGRDEARDGPVLSSQMGTVYSPIGGSTAISLEE